MPAILKVELSHELTLPVSADDTLEQEQIVAPAELANRLSRSCSSEVTTMILSTELTVFADSSRNCALKLAFY